MNDQEEHVGMKESQVDRRGFLECMAWAGTGLVWTVCGGIPQSAAFGETRGEKKGDFNFVQISDSHIGFSKPANADVIGTLKEAVSRIDALPKRPDMLIHTGDLTHLAKPEEFDTLDQILTEVKVPKFYVPGEHDFGGDHGKGYLERFGKGSVGQGWSSFNHKGVHFVGLVNSLEFDGGLGKLGQEQLHWLEKDLKKVSSSAPIVVFAHVPLWSVYPEWGWGTKDSEQALSFLRRFGSVTVLNGHIHQTMQKVSLQFEKK